MLRFRIGSIPVEVRPTHLLVAAWLATGWMPAAHASARWVDNLPAIALGGLVVFVSILVHELGHALVAKLYGFQPSIVIELFGGATSPNATRKLKWFEQVVLSVAGPLAGLTLGILAFVALAQLGLNDATTDFRNAQSANAPLYAQALRFFVAANALWALLNLLPVLPLDGGHISQAILMRLFGRTGFVIAHGLSLLISVALAAYGVKSGQLFIALFFGFFMYRSVQLLSAYFKHSEAVANGQGTPHPSDLAFAQSAALFGERKYTEAKEVADRALNTFPAPPPPSRARLHHLLGWIAVKEGKGREALDHFSQLGGQNAEPQALAAALALNGEDDKALPMWELASRTTRDPSVLAEWAGTLIRLGRVGDARRLSGVDLKEAWRAAASVLYLRHDYAAAAVLGTQALEQFPSAEFAYNAACAFAQAGRLADAQAMLDRAAELGFKDATHAEEDPDLAALRQSTGFSDWLRRVRESARP